MFIRRQLRLCSSYEKPSMSHLAQIPEPDTAKARLLAYRVNINIGPDKLIFIELIALAAPTLVQLRASFSNRLNMTGSRSTANRKSKRRIERANCLVHAFIRFAAICILITYLA